MRPLKRSTIPLVCGWRGFGDPMLDAQQGTFAIEAWLPDGFLSLPVKRSVKGSIPLLRTLSLRPDDEGHL